ncbi:cyclin-domain-containing protein [Xylona heveae TC161]|uniref:Cyclin-domain-containing protein n=1 Tax=Xylona heveae (strain CBS 132557 / TC161) TaxID=1328760 RepID=A0A165F996_XYLHT|nr:cyclin-domain-containing protein [Xylona heveae TC161]KZF20727.1 cyclin-domain-containing protein [Xylona heveae TC161]
MIPSHSPSSGPAAAESAPIAPTNTTPLGKRRETSTSPRTTAQAQQSQTPATPAQPNPVPSASNTSVDREVASPKRLRAPQPALKVMPARYEDCNVKDLIVLISNMLMELVRYNDTIPLSNGGLTRFHSRAPPGISIPDYLARLTTHATLSPPILLSMVYYIDRLCALYPAFNISSLTVHRFLITAATVASKGLSDAFWTNNTYARVGGVSLRELALLELEFLWRVEWRIVPKPEVLVDYYRSLVQRSEGFTIEDAMETNGDAAAPEP